MLLPLLATLALAQEPADAELQLAPEVEERYLGEQRAKEGLPPLGPMALGAAGPCIGAVVGTGYYPYVGTCGCAAVSVVGVPIYYWVNDPPLPADVAAHSPYYIEGYLDQMRRRRTLMAMVGSGAALAATGGVTMYLFCQLAGGCSLTAWR
ncbi:MAG: hypothetical protein H6741_24930 [Alphaproteobacteria bacterium]|nr:hypothetical protein [Alphaproteobacteria bacterium]MCB9795953.1 hypothetical protein [Alphaproteobacteria bacterium]